MRIAIDPWSEWLVRVFVEVMVARVRKIEQASKGAYTCSGQACDGVVTGNQAASQVSWKVRDGDSDGRKET